MEDKEEVDNTENPAVEEGVKKLTPEEEAAKKKSDMAAIRAKKKVRTRRGCSLPPLDCADT